MRLLKPGVKPTRMNIQHPTEQTNRPATGIFTDKGVPQSDSFAKYAALDVGLPEQFSIIGKLRARYPVATLCHVFGVHRSSYKYWKDRP
jgi:hypothetical protein